MIDESTFARIKQMHGRYASWAVWARPSAGPKSDIGDLRVLDPTSNPGLLPQLKTDIVMIGLNASGSLATAFENFHSDKPTSQDYKLRIAFTGTEYEGAYMTDVIKDQPIVSSKELRQRLQGEPSLVPGNITRLCQEFHDISAVPPTLLAFGNQAHDLLSRHVQPSRYRHLIHLPHYSQYVSAADYRQRVLEQIALRVAGSSP